MGSIGLGFRITSIPKLTLHLPPTTVLEVRLWSSGLRGVRRTFWGPYVILRVGFGGSLWYII